MIDNGAHTPAELAAAYLYFIFIAFAIWQGNRYLLFRLRLRFSWLSQPVYKVLALVVSNIFYTIPISVGLMTMWYVFARHAAADWDVIFKATALCVVCVVFITHTYETVFLIKSWGTDRSKSEELAKAKMEAELEALKNQIDPHFLFNSLNTLSHLIGQDPQKAKQFNDDLAEVYRYILSNKDRNLVLLSEELLFAERYFSLLRIRFGSAVVLTVEGAGSADDLLIPPISLQILLENAVKHNAFSEEDPLRITVQIHDAAMTVTNDRRNKTTAGTSSGIGLRNLRDRYRLITGQDPAIQDGDGRFTVTLPLLRTT
ncbi:MAG: histidine kinase [Bacteroidetes bacterium]|nr:histidine kinase [Bacteroidota bacterium]